MKQFFVIQALYQVYGDHSLEFVNEWRDYDKHLTHCTYDLAKSTLDSWSINPAYFHCYRIVKRTIIDEVMIKKENSNEQRILML